MPHLGARSNNGCCSLSESEVAVRFRRWGDLARRGHRVVQFKDVRTNRFVAVDVDGDVKVYQKSER